MTGDQLRRQIADALGHEEWCHYDMDCCGCVCSDSPPRVKTIDELAELVNRVAADELTEAADYMDDWGANAARYKATVGIDSIENAAATARELAYGRAARNLVARAASLRTQEGDHR